MQAFLESAEINASDAWTLFASLDVDGDNVTWFKSNVVHGGKGSHPTQAVVLRNLLGKGLSKIASFGIYCQNSHRYCDLNQAG